MATQGNIKEKIDQIGIAPDENGDLILCYLDQDGHKQMLNLTIYIQGTAKAEVDAHEKRWHGHQI